ncbi:MAG: alkaline phosphatase family protein, partial [Salinibacter sp.]
MRVFLLGLDGATWDLLDPFMAKGAMPRLKALCDRGARGVLRSTQPPVTPTAWTSFQTGMSPGKHGIYGFQRVMPTEAGLTFELTDAFAIQARPFWERLGQDERQTVIVNLPMTYPPRPLDGLLVTGFPTPSQGTAYTYPQGLKDELLNAVPDYRVPTWEHDGPVTDRDVDAFTDSMTRMATARQRAARYLMHTRDWGVFVLQFQATDFIQHPLWHHLDPTHTHFQQRHHETLLRFYETLDALVGELVDDLGSDDHLILLSDHGFQRAERTFYVNRWLIERGWLQLNRQQHALGYRALETLKHLDVFDLRRRWLSRDLQEELKGGWVRMKFDWARSSAYAAADHSGCFGLHLLPGADVNRLLDDLRGTLDPEHDVPIVQAIHSSEELYGNKPVNGAPDLLIELREGYSALPETDRSGPLFASYEPGEDHQIGIHHPDGIIVAHGPEVAPQDDLHAHLVDIAPTVLHHLGLPVPTSMDGRVLTEFYRSDAPQRGSVRYTDDAA